MIDFSKITTYSVADRYNLVTTENIAKLTDPIPDWGDENFELLIEKIITARQNGRPVIFSMGAHVVKNGMSRYIIELIKRGIITHISGNGAVSIHDFELCYNGGTSEDVKTAIEDGSFGMWEETGRWMNLAIQQGAAKGIGYGKALGEYIHNNPEMFPYKNDCIIYNAFIKGIPATYHIALGTDIIHQHPIADFAAYGAASGADFKTMCQSVADLDGGVFLNFGSAVIGPEVFLKALSISRNLGYQNFNITTANFDLINLGKGKPSFSPNDPLYYYRPGKNIVARPVSRGGTGFHFVGDHKATIPNLYKSILKHL